VSWRVQAAYEFRPPLLAQVLRKLPDDEDVTVVPMYATDSAFTHALSRSAVEAHRRIRRTRPSAATAPPAGGGCPPQAAHGFVSVLTQLETEVLGQVCAAHVLEQTGLDGPWHGGEVALVLAAHGTLLEPSRQVDTGLEATEALAAAIERRLAPHFGAIVHGWLNHVRGGRWTEPPIDAALQQVAGSGFKRAVYFPYGFLADNAESQLEGELALRGQARLEALHLPCLNDSPLLIDALASQVLADANACRAASRPPLSGQPSPSRERA
jgi:protoheme ferro-lyase